MIFWIPQGIFLKRRRRKREVVSKLNIFLASGENREMLIKTLCSDNGEEFVNTEVKHVLEKKTINHHATVP